MTNPDSTEISNQYQQPVPATIKSKHAGIQQRHQAANMQRLLYDAMQALKRDCTDQETGLLVVDVKTAASLNRLALAWDKVSDRLRILRGRGLPASVKASTKKSKEAVPL